MKIIRVKSGNAYSVLKEEEERGFYDRAKAIVEEIER